MQHDVRKELEERMDQLARRYAESHDPAVKEKIEELARPADFLSSAYLVPRLVEFRARHPSPSAPAGQAAKKGQAGQERTGGFSLIRLGH